MYLIETLWLQREMGERKELIRLPDMMTAVCVCVLESLAGHLTD